MNGVVMMGATTESVHVKGLYEDGSWRDIDILSTGRDMASAFHGSAIADVEYSLIPGEAVSCDDCGFTQGVGHMVRRYSLRQDSGENLYLNATSITCPRCLARVALPVLPYPDAQQ